MSEYVIPKEYKELYEEWKIECLFKLVGKGNDDLKIFINKLKHSLVPKKQLEIDYEKQAKICLDNKKDIGEALEKAFEYYAKKRDIESEYIIGIWKGWLVEEGLVNLEIMKHTGFPDFIISKKGFDLIYKEK